MSMERLKPNVLWVATMGAGLTGVFGWWLVNVIEVKVSSEILALLVGIGIGGIMTLAGSLADSPPPNHGPCVPAATHEHDMNLALSWSTE